MNAINCRSNDVIIKNKGSDFNKLVIFASSQVKINFLNHSKCFFNKIPSFESFSLCGFLHKYIIHTIKNMNRTTNTSFNAISLKCEKKYRQQTVIIRAAGTVLIYTSMFFVNIPRQTAKYQIPKTTLQLELK